MELSLIQSLITAGIFEDAGQRPSDEGPFHIRSDASQQGTLSFLSAEAAGAACIRAQKREDGQGGDAKWFVAVSVESDPQRKGWRKAALAV